MADPDHDSTMTAVVGVSILQPDGTGFVRNFYLTRERAEEVAEFLGEPDEQWIMPPDVMGLGDQIAASSVMEP